MSDGKEPIRSCAPTKLVSDLSKTSAKPMTLPPVIGTLWFFGSLYRSLPVPITRRIWKMRSYNAILPVTGVPATTIYFVPPIILANRAEMVDNSPPRREHPN